MIVNNGQFAQISVPTGSVGIRTTTSILRRLGYKVTTFSLGQQITHIGRVTLTMLDVRPVDQRPRNAGGFVATAADAARRRESA